MGVQVYLATHDGKGESLSHLHKSFISFSYGGRNIEDFNLISVTNGDRLKRNLYSSFNSLTSNYEVLDGQHYWGTTFSANTLDFTLATDGVSETELQDFRHWFKPDKEKELILSEFPNRAILARVNSVPTLNMLPFEKEEILTIGEQTYKTSTTLWKGDITLSFVMDDPFWYSIKEMIEELNEDTLKVFLEDGVPLKDMFLTSCILGNNKFFNKDENSFSEMILKDEEDKIIKDGLNLSSDSSLFLYYPGSAPAKPILSFVITPSFSDGGFINFPGNSYAKTEYSSITVGSQTFKFTTPSILTAYNQAVKIIKEFSVGDSLLELKKALRDNLTNFYMRGWAMTICEAIGNDTDRKYASVDSALLEGFQSKMISLLQRGFISPEGESKPILCTFNSENGNSLISMDFNMAEDIISSTWVNLTLDELDQLNKFIPIKENAGDMVKTKYLTIEDRKKPSKQNTITENECILVTANCDISNLSIDYKYLYL